MKRKIFAVLLALIIVLGMTGCEKKSEKIRICLDWVPNTNHTGLFVAEAKGYFEQEGLDVEILDAPEGSTTSLVGAGGAEFGITFQDTLAMAFSLDEKVPVTAVAALIQHNTSGVVSLKEKGIDSPRKLEGMSYASWEDPIEIKILEKIISDDGGDFSKVNVIPNATTDVVRALNADVDAVWIYQAWDGMALELAGEETNMLYFRDFGDEFDYYSPVLVGNNAFIEQNPESVKKLLRAVRRGYEDAISNVDEAVEIFMKRAPENDVNLVKKSQEWLKDHYKAEVEQWGYIDQARWDNFFQWVHDNKLIENPIPKGFGFTNEFLN